eukprot:scaffold113649_cov32-Prasinocladus_malaysianus.AAC.1
MKSSPQIGTRPVERVNLKLFISLARGSSDVSPNIPRCACGLYDGSIHPEPSQQIQYSTPQMNVPTNSL